MVGQSAFKEGQFGAAEISAFYNPYLLPISFMLPMGVSMQLEGLMSRFF